MRILPVSVSRLLHYGDNFSVPKDQDGGKIWDSQTWVSA
jgi:hypothetical protein